MKNIKVLDCTLRDGGYVNNWEFGYRQICDIVDKLVLSGIDILECGFLSQTKKTNVDKSIYASLFDADSILPDSQNTIYACMINYGEYNINEIPYCNGKVQVLRVAFHQAQYVEAVEYSSQLINKGYKVFLQPMATQYYDEKALLDLIARANSINLSAFYIVDSFGTMTKNEVIGLFDTLEEKLDSRISIGFHSHNNMQLSFSHAQEIISKNPRHDLIIDSSCYGMGRGAGNLCSELLTKYINDNFENKYDITPILEIIDEYLMPIFLITPWGYSVPYYIASINDCHPNYATFLLEKQSLSIKDIHKILSSLDASKKHKYDKEYIYKMYEQYQNNYIDDKNTIIELTQSIKSPVLLIAPGKTLDKQRDVINLYCKENKPVIISVNFVPESFKLDYVFIGNAKRFLQIDSRNKIRLITTSNIINAKDNSMQVNYSDLICDNEFIVDNSGMMALNLLKRIGVTEVVLAGFDGFSKSRTDNYSVNKLVSGSSIDELTNISDAIKKQIQLLRQQMKIGFLTDSMYED